MYTIDFPLKKNKRKSAKKRPSPVNRGNALLSRGCMKDPALLTGMGLVLFLHIPPHTEVLQDHIQTCTHKAVRNLVELIEGNTIPVDGKQRTSRFRITHDNYRIIISSSVNGSILFAIH